MDHAKHYKKKKIDRTWNKRISKELTFDNSIETKGGVHNFSSLNHQLSRH